MTQLRESRLVAVPIKEAFNYTADFANIENWDPGVATSVKVGNGPVALGSTFDLEVVFGSKQSSMRYEITEYDPPTRVVLTGSGQRIAAVDDIRFTSVDGGTRIDYTADLEFSGVMQVVAPLLGGVLRKVGTKALDGLQAELGKLTVA